jgi:hypothetical protein
MLCFWGADVAGSPRGRFWVFFLLTGPGAHYEANLGQECLFQRRS